MFASFHLSWNYSEFNFGTQLIGGSNNQVLTIQNNGQEKIFGCGNFDLSDSVNFGLTSTTCTSELNVGASCEVNIEFHPQSEGTLPLEIARTCSISSGTVTSLNTIYIDAVIPKVKIIGGAFGDLATAEAYVNSFKQGTAVANTSYDAVNDVFEFTTEANSDFSKATNFLSTGRLDAVLDDPYNLLKKFSSNLFSGNTNTTYNLNEIELTASGLFANSVGVNAKIKKLTFHDRGLSYVTSSTVEIDDAIGDGNQPKFLFNNTVNVIINNDFVLQVGTHGRYTEFCDLRTNNWWYGYNVYEFKGNVTFDNYKNLVGAVGSKLWNATFKFRKDFNIVNSNGLKVFKTIGLTQDNVLGANHVYFYGKIGTTETADFPVGTFGVVNITYHVPASHQTSNAGAVEGDIKNIIDAGGTVLFDL